MFCISNQACCMKQTSYQFYTVSFLFRNQMETCCFPSSSRNRSSCGKQLNQRSIATSNKRINWKKCRVNCQSYLVSLQNLPKNSILQRIQALITLSWKSLMNKVRQIRHRSQVHDFWILTSAFKEMFVCERGEEWETLRATAQLCIPLLHRQKGVKSEGHGHCLLPQTNRQLARE